MLLHKGPWSLLPLKTAARSDSGAGRRNKCTCRMEDGAGGCAAAGTVRRRRIASSRSLTRALGRHGPSTAPGGWPCLRVLFTHSELLASMCVPPCQCQYLASPAASPAVLSPHLHQPWLVLHLHLHLHLATGTFQNPPILIPRVHARHLKCFALTLATGCPRSYDISSCPASITVLSQTSEAHPRLPIKREWE